MYTQTSVYILAMFSKKLHLVPALLVVVLQLQFSNCILVVVVLDS